MKKWIILKKLRVGFLNVYNERHCFLENDFLVTGQRGVNSKSSQATGISRYTRHGSRRLLQ